jgi:hypothetical protein
MLLAKKRVGVPLLILYPALALATPIIPQAIFSASARGGTPISFPGTVTGSECNPDPTQGGCGSSTASIAYSGGDVSAFVNGTSSGGIGAPSSASVGATFFFEVVGPPNVG